MCPQQIDIPGVVLGACAMQAQNNACTIYIYLCGSNLETRQGLAGKNLDEFALSSAKGERRYEDSIDYRQHAGTGL